MTAELAERELAALDPVLADLIGRHGPCPIGTTRSRQSHFESLARSICFQQLAGRAAATIWARTRATVAGPFRAEAVLAGGEAPLRAAGLSGAKAKAVLDLAARVADGRLPLASVSRREDAAVVSALVEVAGIGPWTAQMFLLFQLGRLDVWPIGDLGVRAGYARAWSLPELPSPPALAEAGERFRPWRSVVAWYCWRALEGPA